MFQLFNFETQLNLDEDFMDVQPQDKPIKATWAPTAHSPASIKSTTEEHYPISIQPSVQNSFQIGTQVNHANSIFQSSLQLYNKSIDDTIISQTGFNNPTIYPKCQSYVCQPRNIDEAIKGNRMLRYCQKTNFIQQLQKESELSNLLAELMILFNHKIFGELVYVIHTIWNKKYLKFREAKKSACNILPQFSSFFGFQGFQTQRSTLEMNHTETKQIVEKAEEDIQSLADQLFSSKKLKYLNLREVKGQKKEQEVLKEEFEGFMRKVSKAVFLSAEGVYEQQEPSILSFSEQEEEGAEEVVMNKFARAYSQLQQDDDDEFQITSGPKRHKRF